MRALCVVTMVAGCGRFDFDPRGDAVGSRACVPVGHDEDGDGIDDACDGCPHIADSAQIDSDGDGVDDICDPNPASPHEHIALFDPFMAQLPAWTMTSTVPVSYPGDSLIVDTRGGDFVLRLDQAPAIDYYEFGGSIGAQAGADIKISVAGRTSGPGYYYCELYDPANGMVYFDYAYTYDGIAYSTGPQHFVQAPLENGSFTIGMQFAPPSAVCSTKWPPGSRDVEMIPTGLVADAFQLHAYALQLQLDYFIQIHTD